MGAGLGREEADGWAQGRPLQGCSWSGGWPWHCWKLTGHRGLLLLAVLAWLSTELGAGSAFLLTHLFSPEPSLPSSEVADEPPTLTKEEPVPLETQVRQGGLKQPLKYAWTQIGPLTLVAASCSRNILVDGLALQSQSAGNSRHLLVS